MVRLRGRFPRVLPVLALLVALAPAVPAEAPAPPPSAPSAPVSPGVEARRLVEQARSAFLAAEFEKSVAAAQEALSRLGGEAGGALSPGDRRKLEAATLDLLAQSRFNLGDEKGMNDAIRRLLALDPGWQVDVETAGPKYAKLFEAKRDALVGFLVVDCRPLPCETVTVDGEERSFGEGGRLALVAGTHHVVVRRHGFEPADLGEIDVPAGKETRLAATLRQVARDVVVVTVPPGADVSLDGTAVGTTAPAEEDAGASAPLVLRDVAPGPHVLLVTAPCRRRVEQSLEVVLDESDPSPIELPAIELEEAWGIVRIDWDGAEGLLTLDGSPTRPGEHRVCPGPHEVSLAVGGRRVFVGQVDVRDGETAAVRPRARPTLALPADGAGPFPSLRGAGWNLVDLPASAVEAAAGVLRRALGDGGEIPSWPRVERRLVPEAAAPLLAGAPEADLCAFLLPVRDPLRSLRRLVLVDPHRGIVEAIAWPGEEDVTGEIDGALAWDPPARDPWTGIDLADRVDGPPVIARVSPGSPAARAGILAGELLLAVGDRAAASQAEAEHALAGLAPGKAVELRLRGEEERTVTVTPVPVVHVEPPARLAGRILLPALARAATTRLAGLPAERIPAAVAEGLLLAAGGAALEAARVLDRVSVDATEDPEGDARGTVLFVLEGLLRRLDRDAYADEIAARRAELPRARLGGRGGPPLALAPRD